MKLEFDPSLIEEVIFGELKAREQKGILPSLSNIIHLPIRFTKIFH